jgi:hypothetical protein
MMIAASATQLAESWRPLLESDPKVRKFWQKITTGGGWGAVTLAHGMLAIGIMRAHDISLPSFGKQEQEAETA